MKEWIRWQGTAAFLGVVIVFSVLWFLLIDGIVERMIEKYGTRALGARVELADADLSLFPTALELNRLQITNPDKPMENAVEVGRISLSLDSLNLLRRKVIVDEMALDRVQLNTPRKTSGAVVSKPSAPVVSKKAPKKGLCAAIELPAFEIPSVSEILNRDELNSLKSIASLQGEIQANKDRWKETLRTLPDKNTFDGYRNRIDELKTKRKGPFGGLLGATADAAATKKDIQGDLERIKRARRDFSAMKASLDVKLDRVTTAPLQDVRRLTDKYTLSSEGLANLSRLVLGYRLCGWTRKALAWYEKLKPLLGQVKKKEKGHEVVKPLRGKGVDVRFKEHQPLPDFLVRLTNVSLTLQDGELTGTIKHITPSQDILGIPLTFVFSGENMERFEAISMDGTLNHINPSLSKDWVNSTVRGYKVQNVTLSDNAELPVTLASAVADFNARALLSGDTVSANLTATLTSVKLTGGPQENSGPVAKAISAALSDIARFTVNADVTGTLDDYDIQLSSDLDGIFKQAAGKILQNQSAELEKGLKQAIFARVNGPLGEARDSLGGLDAIGDELTNRLNLGNGLLRGLKLPF